MTTLICTRPENRVSAYRMRRHALGNLRLFSVQALGCRQPVQPPNPPCQGGFWRVALVTRAFRPIPDKRGFWRVALVTRAFRPIPDKRGFWRVALVTRAFRPIPLIRGQGTVHLVPGPVCTVRSPLRPRSVAEDCQASGSSSYAKNPFPSPGTGRLSPPGMGFRHRQRAPPRAGRGSVDSASRMTP